MASNCVLWEAFRRCDEHAVLQLLQDLPELRQVEGGLPLRAACWYGMERVARALIETWAVDIGADPVEIARMRGHDRLARWLEDRRMIKAAANMEQLQLSFIA